MLTIEQKDGLNVALNEARMLGVELDPNERLAAVTFEVLTLPLEGPAPEDCRVQFVFHPVGRMVASLRLGNWDDPNAEVVPFEVGELLRIVEDLKEPIYGWDFFDCEEDFQKWSDRLSLDFRSGEDGISNSISLFQEGIDRHLDLRIWFDSIHLRDPSGKPLDIDEIIAGGQRWWDALYEGNQKASDKGIVPLKGD